MNIGDPPSAAVGQAGDHWVEVTEPLADVMHLLSGQILQEPTSLTGASIAVTEQGTLILNALAWALYRVFSPVSTGVSLLAAWFRLVYAGVLLVAVSHLIEVLRLLGDDQYRAAFNTDQLQAQALSGIHSFGEVFGAGLLLFGLHLLIVGYLAYRSGYVPRLLGVLLAVAGLGYVVDSFGAILFRGSWTDVSSFTFIGEFLLALWLVVRGRRLSLGGRGPHDSPIAATR